MKRLELLISEVNWRIEDEQNDYNEAKRRIKETIDSENLFDAQFIEHYAQQMHEAAQNLIELGQQLRRLEGIKEELELEKEG